MKFLIEHLFTATPFKAAKKWGVATLLCCLSASLITSCGLSDPGYAVIYSIEETPSEIYSEVIDKEYVTKEDLLIAYIPMLRFPHMLAIPTGTFHHFPSSVEDYLHNPNTWYQHKKGNFSQNTAGGELHFIGILQQGARFKLSDISHSSIIVEAYPVMQEKEDAVVYIDQKDMIYFTDREDEKVQILSVEPLITINPDAKAEFFRRYVAPYDNESEGSLKQSRKDYTALVEERNSKCGVKTGDYKKV